jgi:hypothetical protein
MAGIAKNVRPNFFYKFIDLKNSDLIRANKNNFQNTKLAVAGKIR